MKNPSRGLMSSFYRLAPDEGVISPEERLLRMKRMIKRLVGAYGMETVRDKVRAANVPKDLEYVKAYLLLHLL